MQQPTLMRLCRLVPLSLFIASCSHGTDGPAPSITAVDPPLVCNAVTTTLTLTGAGLSPLAVDALTGEPKLALPSVTLQRSADAAGNPITDEPLTLCPDTTDPSCTRVRWLSQSEMQFDIDPELALAPGTYQITVANANGKSFTATVQLEVVEPPEVTDLVPRSFCPSGGDLAVQGSGFTENATVTIGGQEVTIRAITPTEIQGTLGSGLDVGTYDVVVDNGGGCIDTLQPGATIVPGPLLFYVDPPVSWSGIAVEATLYVSGVTTDTITVSIQPTGSQDAPIILEHTWDPSQPNRILARIPAGLAVGDWDVTVDDGNCASTLSMGVGVTETLSVAIESITPPFGWIEETSAVTITATEPAPVGLTQFQATPRVYLNPDVAGPDTVASAVGAVSFVDPTRLTAIVPKGLPAGLYDLIVVNPDGNVGVLDKAFTVTATDAPPPIINDLTPASVVNQPAQAVTVLGSGFRNPAVQATCESDLGVVTIIDAIVKVTTDTSIEVTFDMDALVDGVVCVVRVTNDDGTYADYSALAVASPSQNLPDTIADDGMLVARRALAATAARPTDKARFVYAIGGDDGTDAGLLDSVEAAPVDLFGKLSPWVPIASPLPEGRSMATAVTIGRFIYLVGGRTQTGPTDSVLRAQLLDPRAAPQISDLSFAYAPQGLTPGLYYYLVSAVMDPADPSNPGGETLASDPFAVRVPSGGNDNVVLTLFWSAVPNAASYRIYRTPEPDLLLENATLIGEVAGVTSFEDNATAVPGTAQPLPVGTLGVWHEVGPLDTPREGAGVAAAVDPDDPKAYFLYAMGGSNDAGAALASYTFARVSVADDGSQTVSPFAAGGDLLSTGRWQLGAMAMDHTRASRIAPGSTWIYAMAGFDGTGGAVRDVTAGLVGADGTLGTITEVTIMGAGAGYGYAGANNFLFAFGGIAGGAPASTTLSAEICATGTAGCTVGPPLLRNWNAIGFTLLQPRYLPGSALESAFIFLVGGASDVAGATNTVERTHW